MGDVLLHLEFASAEITSQEDFHLLSAPLYIILQIMGAEYLKNNLEDTM